ncbi:MAG: hypothetical protein IJL64_03545 [Bacteroidales bacterium]|nr:hypothetical protein [Bacteroidales bacterium]
MTEHTSYFRVAGHVFGMAVPAGVSPDDTLFGNYRPFATTKPAGPPLFVLERVEALPPAEGEVVLRDAPTLPDMPRTVVRKNGPDWWVDMAPAAQMPYVLRLSVRDGFRRARYAVRPGSDAWAKFALDNALMLLFALATAASDTLEIHASSVMLHERGYAFLGPSGTGKSTHSHLWLSHLPEAELLNDDNPVLRAGQDAPTYIYGTPWSGKTPCYRDVSVPLGAVVLLAQAPRNAIQKLNPVEAYASLFSAISGLKMQEPMASDLHRTMERVVLQVPFYRLECLPDKAAAVLCASAVMNN